ncbi:hypothetical protein N9E34_02160 [Opitutales bacterium]|jgi:hypothetical protein|nr:hypothetical protein [Opitutales bacterium]
MNLLVCFDHGYNDSYSSDPGLHRPALWHLAGNQEQVISIPFPRDPEDFKQIDSLFQGTKPLGSAKSFEKLPRYGLAGMIRIKDQIFASSWNSIYEIDSQSFEVKKIISHPLICDAHGIAGDERFLITVLTSKDTVVLTDFDGKVVDHFSIMRDLSIKKLKGLNEIDWRFISKQYRGSCGFWHFNHAQLIGDELWLTSRNASCFVVIDLMRRKAHLRLINHRSPHLLHDGVRVNGRFYFTSIDGKIIIAEDSVQSNLHAREDETHVDNLEIYHRDLVSKVIKLSDPVSLNREPNWCRGLEVCGETIFTTIDGAYGSELSFGLLGILESGKVVFEKRLNWSDFGDENELRYMSGFDVMNLNKNKENS